MTTFREARDVAAPTDVIASVLLNISELPSWNPALLESRTDDTRAIQWKVYSVATRIPGPATMVYETISENEIRWRLSVVGGVEVGVWRIHPSRMSSRVVHEIAHTGPIFALLRGGMGVVPGLRLDRLAGLVAFGER